MNIINKAIFVVMEFLHGFYILDQLNLHVHVYVKKKHMYVPFSLIFGGFEALVYFFFRSTILN